MRSATSSRKPASLRTWQHNMATVMQPFHYDLPAKIQEPYRTTYIRRSSHCRTQRRNQSHTKNERSAPAAHPRYFSSPAGATLHGKTQGFVPKLSPKTEPMPHPCSHNNTFCTLTSPTRLYLRTRQHNMATLMQPFHYDLPAKIQEPQRTT